MINKSLIYSLSLLCFLGCATTDFRTPDFNKRIEGESYKVTKIDSNGLNDDFQMHFLRQKKDHYKVHGFKDGNDFVLVTDSGEEATKDVACTLIKAEGRARIIDWLSKQLYQNNQGQPWDLFLKNMTKDTLNTRLKEELTKSQRVSFYGELREHSKETRFVCAVAISISKKMWNQAISPLVKGIQKEYFHLSLDKLNLAFPVVR